MIHHPQTTRWPLPRLAGCLLALACLVAAGCDEELDATYGRRTGMGSQSVNGTGILARMIEDRGGKVSSWRALSPRLERADCIVWFPDDYPPPNAAAREWLDQWLMTKQGRTLIYVGRDFDAEPFYWQAAQAKVAAADKAEFARRQQASTARHAVSRAAHHVVGDHGWFSLGPLSPLRGVTTLNGQPGWTDGIDPTKLDLELSGTMQPADMAEVLLDSNGNMIVSQEAMADSQLIVVANGSFLVNAAMVNHEHRKLAGKLLDEEDWSGKNVVFLESGRDGPPIVSRDPSPEVSSGLEILVEWPYIWIFAHGLAVAALLCVSRWPIFGLPRALDSEPVSDFGRHVAALAALLRATGNRAYALSRLIHYRQVTGERKQ